MNGRWTSFLCAAIAYAGLTASCARQAESPATPATTDWAYPVNPDVAPPAGDQSEIIRLPGSDVAYTRSELRNLFSAPDWRPQDHPAMPEIVARGRPPKVQACGFCHLPTGNGRPENVRLAGLPHDYIVAQMKDWRDGTRRSSAQGRLPTDLMATLAREVTEEEAAAAAAYFSALTATSYLRVEETRLAPETEIAGWVFKLRGNGAGVPIGQRIIEAPEDFERFERRDPKTAYVAFVPEGSIARGKEYAETWGENGSLACAACHGERLAGAGSIPGLAGRSPSYIVRQLHDFKTGARRGVGGAAMTPVVEDMSDAQMLALAAYLASLPL